MAQNWNSLQLSELGSFGIAILLLVSYHCPLLHSVVLPRQMICWNWIGMMNGCWFTWIVIKSWVFCKAKFSLCDLNDNWYLFFCQSRLTILKFPWRFTVFEIQGKCSIIPSTGFSLTCLSLWWASFYQW